MITVARKISLLNILSCVYLKLTKLLFRFLRLSLSAFWPWPLLWGQLATALEDSEGMADIEDMVVLEAMEAMEATEAMVDMVLVDTVVGMVDTVLEDMVLEDMVLEDMAMGDMVLGDMVLEGMVVLLDKRAEYSVFFSSSLCLFINAISN